MLQFAWAEIGCCNRMGGDAGMRRKLDRARAVAAVIHMLNKTAINRASWLFIQQRG